MPIRAVQPISCASHRGIGAVVAARLDHVGVRGSAAPRNPQREEGDHQHVHQAAHAEEEPEQVEELAVLDGRCAEDALIMLVRASAEQQRCKGCRDARRAAHCCAASELVGSGLGVRVCGVGPLISSARLETASLLGRPESERT